MMDSTPMRKPVCRLFGAATVVCGLLFCQSALADNCANLDSNQDWKTGFETLYEQVNQGLYDDALRTGERLYSMCERSPILNYTLGKIYREKGDDTKTLYYFQRATLYTSEFSVNGTLLEQMWYDRYLAENPEARPESISSFKRIIKQDVKEIEKLSKENEKLRAESASNSQVIEERSTTLVQQANEDALSACSAGLWTGVGIASAGVVLTILGGSLMAVQSKDAIQYDNLLDDANHIKTEYYTSKHPKGKIDTKYYVYTGMLFSGIGLAVAGGIVAGIMGVKYSNLKDNTQVAIGVAPNGVGLGLTF